MHENYPLLQIIYNNWDDIAPFHRKILSWLGYIFAQPNIIKERFRYYPKLSGVMILMCAIFIITFIQGQSLLNSKAIITSLGCVTYTFGIITYTKNINKNMDQ